MKKSLLVVLIVGLFALSGCLFKSTPDPVSAPESTNTQETSKVPEATNTQEPTNTAEPTNTPTVEYCSPEEYVIALEVIVEKAQSFNDQVQIYIEMLETSTGDFQDVLVEVSKLQRVLSDLDVPECMTYLKQTLNQAMSDLITAVTYATAGDLDTSSVKIIEATTQVGLFIDELTRLGDCFPNCQP